MLGSRLQNIQHNFPVLGKRFKSDTFQTGDYVIITPLKKTVTKKQWLSRPLKDLPNAKVNLNFGKIPHSDLIGAAPLGKVHTIETRNKLAKYICSRPTLEQWITFSQRKAQPIYSFDAQAIVALTDLHIDYPEPPTEDGEKITPLQFLEAGTGHGSLTLAISKALHPANALAHYASDPNLRGAILHTIDCNGSHSITGKRTLKGFRRGMYLNNVEFHVAESPSGWVASQEGVNWMEREVVSKRKQNLEFDPDQKDAFLSGVFLDMPNYQQELVKLAPYVKTGGFIIAFCPSITQIIDAIDAIAIENERLAKLETPVSLNLEHERTVQLLDGAGGGLKEWDTRRTLIRATGKIGYSVRPKVGVRTVAGGFVAIWRKLGKDVNLELERDLMESYEGKPDPTVESQDELNEESSATTEEEQQAANPQPQPTQPTQPSEPVQSSESESSSLSSKEKAAMYAPELLSTDPEVFEDAREKLEKNQDQDVDGNVDFEEPELSDEDVNSDFKIEEAVLVPHSVLHTVHHSCHGDPDVHVGYITDVYMIPTPKPDDVEEDDLLAGSSKKEQPELKEISKVTGVQKDGISKVWTKHTL